MRKIILFSFVIILFFNTLSAQFSYESASTIGYGNSASAVPGFWSGMMNPAALGWLSDHQLGINYYNKYLLKELGYRDIAYAHVLNGESGTISAHISQFGASSLLYNTFSVGYSRVFADRVAAGLTIKYFLLTSDQPEYSGIGTIGFDAGLQVKIIDNLYFGTVVSNLNHSKLGTYGYDRLPIVGSLGFMYQIARQSSLMVDIVKESDKKASVRFGTNFSFNDKLYVRGGFQTTPSRVSFGVGYRITNFIIDVSSSWHQTLGFSPAISMSYSFKKDRQQPNIIY
ncbi:MAG: hypothetical protein GX048_02495 [Bacteroidales bacterium]|nr:hypothetical protein [Bacteroidales bacterium]